MSDTHHQSQDNISDSAISQGNSQQYYPEQQVLNDLTHQRPIANPIAKTTIRIFFHPLSSSHGPREIPVLIHRQALAIVQVFCQMVHPPASRSAAINFASSRLLLVRLS